MKKLLRVFLIVSVLLTFLALPASAAKPTKVLVCHNGKLISVAQSSVAAAEAHGDSVGTCKATGD